MRDEQDILATNIDYHLAQGVDLVIVTDNCSVDATPDILRAFASTGAVHVIEEPGDDYSQARWVTRMARMACTDFGADWVINGDADEFWWPESGDLRSVLDAVPTQFDVVTVPRMNFVPVRDETPPFPERMIMRHNDSRNALGEMLPPKVCHRARPDIVVAQGNHAVEAPGLAAAFDQAPISIMHFPLRTYAQFENKIVKGGRAYERNADLDVEVGATWRVLYQEYLAGRLREAYDREVAADAGALVVDERLRHFLRHHGIPGEGW